MTVQLTATSYPIRTSARRHWRAIRYAVGKGAFIAIAADNSLRDGSRLDIAIEVVMQPTGYMTTE